MPAGSRRCLAPALATLAVALSSPAAAQSHFRLRPSLELVAGWDDNILSTPQPAARDWVGRATPGLEATVTGPRSVFGARYGGEAEGFMDHRELSEAPSAQHGEAWLDFEGARWTARGRGAYDETNDPSELKDLSADPAHAAELQRLRDLLERAQGEYGDRLPLRTDKPQPLEFDFTKVKSGRK